MEETTVENKKSTSKLPFIIIAIAVLLGIGGFIVVGTMVNRARKVTNEATGKVEVNTDNNTVKIKSGDVSTEVGGKAGVKWPNNLPVNIPKYTDGQIKAVGHANGEKVWIISIGKTSLDAFNKYKQGFKSTDWKIINEVNMMVNSIQMEKGSWQMSLTFDPSSKGAMITISSK